jgi:hypothetical protein
MAGAGRKVAGLGIFQSDDHNVGGPPASEVVESSDGVEVRSLLGYDTTDLGQFGEAFVPGYNALMKTNTAGRPPTRFLRICPHINRAYAALRIQVKDMGYVPQGNNGSSVEQYALGFIREIAAAHLSKEKVQAILSRLSDRKIWSSASHMQHFVPLMVKEVIDSGNLTASQFLTCIQDRAAFKAFADHKKANSRSRSA